MSIPEIGKKPRAPPGPAEDRARGSDDLGRRKRKKQERKEQKAQDRRQQKDESAQQREEQKAREREEKKVREAEETVRRELELSRDEGSDSFLAALAPYVLVMVALLVFGASVNVPFLFDDAPVLTHNRLIHVASAESVARLALKNPSRFLTNLTFFANFHLAGTPPNPPFGPTWSYHVVSLLLHALNSVLVYLFVRGILRSRYYRQAESREAAAPEHQAPELIAFACALLFAIHPCQTMAVAYIAQRYALLAATFLLGTLVAWNRWRRQVEEGRASLLPWTAILLSLGCYLTKENAAVVGLVVIAVEVLFHGSRKLHVAMLMPLPFLFGVAVRGVLIGPPAFEPSTSVGFGLLLIATLIGGAIALVRWPRLLPEGWASALITAGGDANSTEDAKAGDDPTTRPLPLRAALRLAGPLIAIGLAALVALVMTEERFRGAVTLSLLVLLALLGGRLYWHDRTGILPPVAFFSGVGAALLLMIMNTAEDASFLDRFFAAPPVYDDEEAHWQYFLTQTRASLYYLRLIFLPWGYSAEHAYPITPIDDQADAVLMTGKELVALLGHGLMIALAWRCRTRSRALTFAIVWYYLGLLITSSIIPILDPVVEQRAYLPLAACALAFAVVTARVVEFIAAGLDPAESGKTPDAGPNVEGLLGAVRARLGLLSLEDEEALRPARLVKPGRLALALGLFALPLPLLTADRVEVWSSEEAVWEDAIAKRPDCARAWSSLGMVRLNLAGDLARTEGDAAATRMWLAAVGPISAALELGPYHVEGWNNLGKAYLELDSDVPMRERSRELSDDRLVLAERALLRGIQVGKQLQKVFKGPPGPAVPLCHNNLGLVYRRMALRRLPPISAEPQPRKALEDLEAAIKAVREAVDIDPGYTSGLGNLAALRLQWTGFQPDPEQRSAMAVQAIREIQAALATGRARISLYRNYAECFALLGRNADVLKILQSLTGARGGKAVGDLCWVIGLRCARRCEALIDYYPNVRLSPEEISGAEALLTRALAEDSGEAVVGREMLARLAIAGGRRDDAVKHLRAALAATPTAEAAGRIKATLKALGAPAE